MITTQFKALPIDCLQRGQFQPRTQFDETALQELASSIKAQGLIEPLVVRPLTDASFEIIAGERRWRAAMMAGLSEVPCLVTDYSDEAAAAVTLIENIQRQDLGLLDEANGYQRLLSEFHFNQAEVAALVGKSRSHIANLLRLLTLCPPVQAHIYEGQLSLGHARMLVGLEESIQKNLASRIIEHQWSVRKLEEAVRSSKQSKPTENPPNRDIARLEAQLAEQMGAPVQLTSDNDQGGWIKIKFYDNETLSGLLDRMGLSYD